MNTRPLWLAFVLVVSLAAPSLSGAQSVAAQNHRVSVQVLDPDTAPVKHWQVKVQATYGPLVQGAPNTTETTTSRANCSSPAKFGSIVPSFKRCTRTFNRTVYVKLPAAQITAADPRALNLDFAPVIEDHGGTFAIEGLVLEYMSCAKGCENNRVDIRLTCFADDVEQGEVLAEGLLLGYSRGPKAPSDVADCGLKEGDEVNWANRDTVMARVRGHFADDQQMVSSEMLNSFSAIPAADQRWLWNPAHKRGMFDKTCTLPDDQSFVNSTYMATLPVAVGWPYRHTAEVYVTSKPGGEVCSIWLSGTDDETYLRYFYDFDGGKLVKVSTSDEPQDISREWRWVNGEPWEFTRRRMPDSVAGHDEILYWHNTAAQQWPKRMDYKPDLKTFAALNDFAQQLLSRFPPKQP